MAAMLIGWGPHRFEVGRAAFEELLRHVEARWEKHAIIGRRPAAQYLGPGEETVTLRGTIYPVDQGGGLEQIVAALLADCRAGATYTLLPGSGDVAGPHRLESAKSVESFHLPDATPQKVTYDLTFAVHDDGFGQIWSLWP